MVQAVIDFDFTSWNKQWERAVLADVQDAVGPLVSGTPDGRVFLTGSQRAIDAAVARLRRAMKRHELGVDRMGKNHWSIF